MDWLLAGGIILGIATCMVAMPRAIYTLLDRACAAAIRWWARRRNVRG